MRSLTAALLLALLVLPAPGCGGPSVDPKVLRIGHFPNVTHAHGLIAHRRSTQGKGIVEAHLPAGMRVEWYVFKAGPDAMEALRAKAIDATYVGPSPALNAHIQTRGGEVRVLSGATRGGSAFVVGASSNLAKPEDFRGKRIATPQIGNTQDVAARNWLAKGGLQVTLTGGDAAITGLANPEQLSALKRGDVDAVWTVEPWVSRLESEAGGKVLVDEPDAVTTVLVGSAKLLADRPDAARGLLAAHRELTAWIAAHPDEAREEVRLALEAETRAKFPPALLAKAWARMKFEDRIERAEFEAFVEASKRVGFLTDAIPLDRLMGAP